VIAGALRFRFAGEEVIAGAGSTVLVPAGVAHTFGNGRWWCYGPAGGALVSAGAEAGMTAA
jgi:hypothetical protein